MISVIGATYEFSEVIRTTTQMGRSIELKINRFHRVSPCIKLPSLVAENVLNYCRTSIWCKVFSNRYMYFRVGHDRLLFSRRRKSRLQKYTEVNNQRLHQAFGLDEHLSLDHCHFSILARLKPI